MRSPLRVLAVVGVLAAAGLAAWSLRGSFQMPVREPRRAAVDPVPVDDGGEDVVARALRLASIDSTKKQEWVSDIPDLELVTLTAKQRELFLRIANTRRCNCGCGFTLAGCRRFDSECEVSGPRAKALFDSVHAGLLTSAEGFPERPDRESHAALQRPNRRD